MIRVALRGMAGRKLRAFLTALAIVLGVAMMSGAYVLTDTIDKAFNAIFVDSYAGTDAVVTGKSADISFEGEQAQAPPIPEETLEQVRQVDGVEVATGSVQDFRTKLVREDGEAVGTGGAPSFAFGIETSEEYDQFNPLNLVEGRWASGGDEVVIDEGTADGEDLGIGDTIGVAALGPAEEYEIVGIAKYGDLSSIGSATFAIFDIPTAQRLLDKEGQLDSVQAAAGGGLTADELTRRIASELGSDFTVRTGVEQADEDSGELSTFTNIIRYFLLSFAGIALFVGAFVIFNTLSITVAQRTREFATLRTIGASRRQVLTSVIVEALVIGFTASVIGLFAGLGLAVGLNELFIALNLDLPQTQTVFATRTIVVSLAVGTIITLVAGLFPALRATRVPPIAAVREGAELPPSRFHRYTTPIAGVIVAIAVVALSYAMLVDDVGTANRFILLGVGVLALFIGVAMLSSRLVVPLVTAIGPVAGPLMRGLEILFFPLMLGFSLLGRAVRGEGLAGGRRIAFWAASLGIFLGSGLVGVGLFMLGSALPAILGAIPLALGLGAIVLAAVGLIGCTLALPVLLVIRAVRGTRVPEPAAVESDRSTQTLGKENARRNPGRTAATAAALMIGIALVTFVAVLAQGLRVSNSDAIERQIQSDLIVTSQDGYSEFPAPVGDAVEEAGIGETVSNVRQDTAEIAGSGSNLTGLDDRAEEVYGFTWQEGSDELLGSLGDDGAILPDDVAEDKDLAVGAGGLRRAVREATQPLHAAERAGRPERGVPDAARDGARGLPGHARVHTAELDRQGGRGDRPVPAAALRPARALRDHQPLRHGQHARALRLRAHARARHAPRSRDDAAAGAADDPARKRDDGADRSGARPSARDLPRAARHAGPRPVRPAVRDPDRLPRHLRDRRHRRRNPRRGASRPPSRTPARPRRAAVRVAPPTRRRRPAACA